DSNDALSYGTWTIDVWIDTARNGDGSTATCSTGDALSIAGYDLVLGGNSQASLTFHDWTNAMSDFTEEVGFATDGQYLWASYRSPGGATFLAPGTYKLGSASFTGSGCSYVVAFVQASISGQTHGTSFLSECPGSNLDGVIRLGADFYDVCGTTGICDDVKPTTWGKIKDIYRNR
ncbi:MAG: hypothetical protein ACM3JJ_00995, partial [Hyphomicrobiales bacterium]